MKSAIKIILIMLALVTGYALGVGPVAKLESKGSLAQGEASLRRLLRATGCLGASL
jgi:hypothetical protein